MPLLVRGHQNLEKFLHSGLIVCFCGLHLAPVCPYRLASITNPVRELSPKKMTVVIETTYNLNYNKNIKHIS